MPSKRERQEAAGRWLRAARERGGYRTADAFARRIEVSASLLSRYETGITGVSDEMAERIADVLGLGIIETRRGLGLWVPPEDTEPASAASPEEVLAEQIRRDPRVRRRFFDLLLAEYGHAQEPDDSETPDAEQDSDDDMAG